MAELVSVGMAAAWYVVFLVSVCLHEAAHALAALRLGDPTAHRGGQVSVNPWPHIRREPLGTVIVPLVSYLSGGGMIGWASTPYDREWAARYPRRAALMALAGPCANLALAIAAGVVIRAAVSVGVWGAPSAVGSTRVAVAPDGLSTALATGASLVLSMNVGLLALNLLPVPPLDGGAALARLLPGDLL